MRPDLTVFMYHRVLPFEHPEAVTSGLFAEQLDFLRRRYVFLTPEQAFGFIRTGTVPEGKKARHYAMLSFDDGWLDNLLYADPVLKERGLSASIAISAGTLRPGKLRTDADEAFLNVGMDQAREDFAQGKPGPFLNETEIRFMAESGRWSIQVHGTVHRKGSTGVSMLALPEPGTEPADFEKFAREDLKNCSDQLERITGHQPEAVFWPWGHYSATSVRIARELGFSLQFTVTKGTIQPGDRNAVLPRIGISRNVKKMKKNVFVSRSPLMAAVHDMFHTEKVRFETPSAEGTARLEEYTRKELYQECCNVLSNLSGSERRRACAHLFWEPAFVQGNDVQPFYGELPDGKFNAVDFFDDAAAVPTIRICGKYRTLPVTVSRVLPFKKYGSAEAWFSALSDKNRKKLRWLRNAVPKTGAHVLEIKDESGLEKFLDLYGKQFRDDPEFMRKGPGALILHLIRKGCGKGLVLESPDGTPLAALFGYRCNHSFFFTHLTRGEGNPAYNEFSPGYYLTWYLIDSLFRENPETLYFFMGPGEYDYKQAFLGEKSMIRRCEKNTFSNLPGLVRMQYRLHKEKRRFLNK